MNVSDRLRAALVASYDLKGQIGSGGMATVYLADDLKHRRQVAVKVLKPELAAAVGTQRFLQEIEIAARLTHPNILPVHDSGEAGGLLYYVMPYIAGESLRQRLCRGKPLPLEESVRVATQVASALDYAHRQGVIHRDVKPENILLHEGSAIVADFGIALGLQQATADRLTATGFLVGSPEYMSPEQLRPDHQLDGRSDIYALGCVLYEMLVGEPPHTAPTAEAMIGKRLADPVPSVRRLRAGIPRTVDDAISRALAKAPADRFATASEFGKALSARDSDLRASSATSIVVLPFTNLSSDFENEYFSDGLTEELITDLSKIRSLRVISRTSAMRLKNRDKDLETIRRELDVEYVLEGSVRKAGNNLRIAAQLIDAASDTHVWAEKYTGTLQNIFELQEQVSKAITNALQLQLSPLEHRSLAKRPVAPEVHDLFLRGRYYHFLWSEAGIRQAIEYFQQAIAKDPGYAAAHVALAEAYAMLSFVSRAGPRSVLSEALTAASRALDLDDSLAEAHALVGVASLLIDYDWGRAGRSFERAIELNPGATTPRAWFGALYLTALGRYDDAIGQTRRWMQVDPLNPGPVTDLGWELYFARQYDRAIEELDRALAMNPNYEMALWIRGLACEQTLMLDEAIKVHERAVAASARLPAYLAGLARAYAVAGQRTAAREILAELEQERTKSYVGPYHTAAAYAGLGETGSALEWLERGHMARDGWMVFANVDPQFDGLRGDSGFQAILSRMNLPR